MTGTGPFLDILCPRPERRPLAESRLPNIKPGGLHGGATARLIPSFELGGVSMRPVLALAVLLALAACQVTTSQSMGGGVAVRSSAPIGEVQGADDRTADPRDTEATEATEDRAPALTIGGGTGTGVSN